MVDFNDFDYSKLDPNSKIYKLAARSDRDVSGRIDNSDEKSIFLRGANNLVRDKKLDENEFRSIFGFDYGTASDDNDEDDSQMKNIDAFVYKISKLYADNIAKVYEKLDKPLFSQSSEEKVEE